MGCPVWSSPKSSADVAERGLGRDSVRDRRSVQSSVMHGYSAAATRMCCSGHITTSQRLQNSSNATPQIASICTISSNRNVGIEQSSCISYTATRKILRSGVALRRRCPAQWTDGDKSSLGSCMSLILVTRPLSLHVKRILRGAYEYAFSKISLAGSTQKDAIGNKNVFSQICGYMGEEEEEVYLKRYCFLSPLRKFQSSTVLMSWPRAETYFSALRDPVEKLLLLVTQIY
ncbi:hypothetical protein SELMODRAFT_421811 [Selaginella moellendorffii]|uniref:Uncharacterized protein n=1 Tax=Selaginella moellendorffii TaxID=88036 RepID=D8SGF5_SELML|nr:hypothetical protein SELMODRAFT_421811 [Selaginella moellendorffii]